MGSLWPICKECSNRLVVCSKCWEDDCYCPLCQESVCIKEDTRVLKKESCSRCNGSGLGD